VLVDRGNEWVVEAFEVGAGMKLSPPPDAQPLVVAAPRAVRLQVAPAPAGSQRVEIRKADASLNDSARQIEELRAELKQLKEMLKGLSKQLEAENR